MVLGRSVVMYTCIVGGARRKGEEGGVKVLRTCKIINEKSPRRNNKCI